jgi:hypothetical protein
MKAMPMVTAALKALPGFDPKIKVRMKIMMGIITGAPKALMNSNTLRITCIVLY